MCGIGGRTIAEAQDRLSYHEFLRWSMYRRKRGSLNGGLRTERGTALLATLYANNNRNKDTPAYALHDFAIYHDVPGITLDQAMKDWG